MKRAEAVPVHRPHSSGDGDDLPIGWTETTLDRLLTTLESGSRPRGGVRGIAGGIPSIGGEHISEDGGFRFEKIKFVPKAFYETMRRGHLRRGDILVVKDGATTGKVGIVGADFPHDPAVVNEHVFICRPANEVDSRFLFWFLHSQVGQDRILQNFRGSAQGGITQSFAEGTVVPLAPPAEQKRIVAKLDALLARVRAARDRLARVPSILKQFRQSVLAAACSGTLSADWRRSRGSLIGLTDGELPAGWKREVLSAVCEGFEYGSAKKSSGKGAMPVLRMGNLQDGEIDWSDLVYTSDPEEIAKYSLQPNTVLFNRTNSPELVGKTSIYRGERRAIFAGYLIRIRHGPRLDPAYLNYCLNSPEFKEYCLTVRTDGVSQSNINARKLAAYEIPWCNLDEQLEIARRVKALFARADAIEVRVAAATARADRLTQSLLARAFRGELVPQDPNDEPASQLLQKIRANVDARRRVEAGDGSSLREQPRAARRARRATRSA
jgi:type I restriction enzyme S subunit